MRKILRNAPTPNKTNPDSLENTRDPAEYKDALVKARNGRYKDIWTIDPAKAKIVNVRQNSFKPWMAKVHVGEDVLDAEGKVVGTRQMSTDIERKEFPVGTLEVERAVGETPYDTWRKVETAAGLEENELVGQLTLTENQHSAVYQIDKLSLNWYGEVKVKFKYPTP